MVFRSRKRLLLVAAAIAILAVGVKAFWLEPASLTLVRQSIVVRGLADKGVRIAILTDLHVGSPFNGIDNLKRVVALTNTQQPDLICILGDLVVEGVRGGHFVQPEDIARELKQLHSQYGTFAVLGNHDGWLDHDRVATALAQNDVHVIEESATRLETTAGSLWLAGVSDLWTGQHDVGTALKKVTDSAPVILLTHNPDIFPQVPPRVSLTLAGHTHGGQVRLPLVGTPVVPSQFGQRYASGLIAESGRQMYVSTGVGTSIIPVRFRVPPSVTIVTLSGR